MSNLSSQSRNEPAQSSTKQHGRRFIYDFAIALLVTVAISIGGTFLAWYLDNLLLALLATVLVMFALNLALLLWILKSQRSAVSSERISVNTQIIKDENEALYLLDTFGRARPLPDDPDTISYLQDLMPLVVDVNSGDIKPRIGEAVESLRRWQAPLTPQETKRRHLQQNLKLRNVEFVDSANPQCFRLTFRNEGAERLQILEIQAWHIGQMFNSNYENVNGRYRIPFDKLSALLEPSQSVKVDVELRAKWERDEIFSVGVEWGSLYIDVLHNNERYELFYALR